MFQTLFDNVDYVVVDNLAVMIKFLIDTITPLLEACVLLYGLYLVYKILFDNADFPIMDGVKFLGALGLMTSMALSAPWLYTVLFPFVTEFGSDVIAGQLVSYPSGGAATALQGLLDNSYRDIKKVAENIHFDFSTGETYIPTLLLISQIVLIFIGTLGFMLVATLYLVVTKILLSFLVFLSPIFISFSFFPATRSFFQQWTGQLFNYMLLSLMFPITFIFFGEIADATISTTSFGIDDVLMTALMYLIFLIIAVQLASFCGSLSGGIGINGLVRDASQALGAANKVITPVQSAGKSIAKGAGNLGVKGISKAANYGKGAIKPG